MKITKEIFNLTKDFIENKKYYNYNLAHYNRQIPVINLKEILEVVKTKKTLSDLKEAIEITYNKIFIKTKDEIFVQPRSFANYLLLNFCDLPMLDINDTFLFLYDCGYVKRKEIEFKETKKRYIVILKLIKYERFTGDVIPMVISDISYLQELLNTIRHGDSNYISYEIIYETDETEESILLDTIKNLYLENKKTKEMSASVLSMNVLNLNNNTKYKKIETSYKMLKNEILNFLKKKNKHL